MLNLLAWAKKRRLQYIQMELVFWWMGSRDNNESTFIKKRISGSEENTTNNKMELKAVINGLKMLKISCEVILHTYSLYVKQGITEWISKWKANGWRTATKNPDGIMEGIRSCGILEVG